MKKLFRLLLAVLFVSSMSTVMYAMTQASLGASPSMAEQKDVKSEQKMPRIKANNPRDLVREIDTKLLKQGRSSESIVAEIKQQKIDINARNQCDVKSHEDSFNGWTAL